MKTMENKEVIPEKTPEVKARPEKKPAKRTKVGNPFGDF